MSLLMIASRRLSSRSVAQRVMKLSSSSETPSVRRTGASLWQRLTSFAVGAGFTAIFTQYYIWQELAAGNLTIISKQQELEERMLKLEKKK